jgi:small GTP-binding protein
MDDREQEREVENRIDEALKQYELSVTVAVVGKVSSGKSSLLNAFIGYDKTDQKFKVSALSGTTKKAKKVNLEGQESVTFIDTPGLDDVHFKNTQVTLKMLSEIDVGIFLITGSSDSTQVKDYEKLKKLAKKVFVVLNKIDEFDKKKNALPKVTDQWAKCLEISPEEIYLTCVYGYDEDDTEPLKIIGVDKLRNDVLEFLEKNKKDILMSRVLKDKRPKAVAIIATATVATAAEALLPLSTVSITVTQVIAIASLYYLYTGKIMSKREALALIPAFLSGAMGKSAFLVIKSFLPSTGIIDAIAVGVAVTITFSMLTSIAIVLRKNHSLENTENLKRIFENIQSMMSGRIKNANLTDLRSKDFWVGLISDTIQDDQETKN